MRVLRPVIGPLALVVASREPERGAAVRAELVCHHHGRGEALLAEQGGVRVAPPLHEYVEDLALLSTARQSQNRLPPIRTTISSRCQVEPGRVRRRRSSRAKSGPNLSTQ